MALLASTLLAAGLQAGQQYLSNRESKRREAEYKGETSDQERAMEAARQRIADIDFSPGSGVYELEQERKLQAELLGSESVRRGDEREARALSALQDSPRMMQALAPRIISQSEDAQQKAQLQTGQMKVDATATTTKAEEAAADKTRQRDMMLDQIDMERAGRSFDTFTEAMYGERAARAEGNRALLSELGETAVALGGAIDARADQQTALDRQMDLMSTLYGTRSTDEDEGFVPTTDQSFSEEEEEVIMGDGIYDLGGYIGKEGGVTDGEFSHKTNKIALVDQEDGEKLGEVTGGEGILNPNQFKNLNSVKALLDKLAASPSASAEIKKAAELLAFLEGEQFQDA
jgi:hypothetical protein